MAGSSSLDPTTEERRHRDALSAQEPGSDKIPHMDGNAVNNGIPVSFKAIVFDDTGNVLLAKNSRQEWELPGGRPDTTDTSPQHTVEREVREETGLQVQVRRIVDSWLYPAPGHGTVAIVSYLCDPVAPSGLCVSAEHSALRFFSPAAIDTIALPTGYRTSIHRSLRMLGAGA